MNIRSSYSKPLEIGYAARQTALIIPCRLWLFLFVRLQYCRILYSLCCPYRVLLFITSRLFDLFYYKIPIPMNRTTLKFS
ncbi:Hypothetical protein A7A1_3024 [Bacillus subtilis subsp. subtilis str. BSP1]|nr:Hypothetical protein A7A1_3024 [Bacillus subtilis subsp. subtilis str. BSP1]